MPPRTKARPAADTTNGKIDFDALDIEPDDKPLAERPKGRQAVPIPQKIVDAVRKSEDQVMRLSVTPATFVNIDRMLRRAANMLDTGLAIRYFDAEGEHVTPDFKNPEYSKVASLQFQARSKRSQSEIPRRPREPKRREKESEASFTARMAGYERKLTDWEIAYG